MQVNINEFMKECGVDEKLYPGKRLVHRLPQPGEHKSHCVVYDWRNPGLLHIEVKAGLSGKDMLPKDLKKFPISFQSPTYVDIDMAANTNNEAAEDDEDGEEGSKGKGGGGGKKPKARKVSLQSFSQMVEGKIPDLGEVKKLVLMGKNIARDAMAPVLASLAAQIKTMAVAPVNILANISKVTKIAPGGRPASEVDPSLLKDAKPYKPKDLFGAAPS
ncbi:MAG: hypothetical protein KKA05_06775 [Alphaproteobacteria bacterium]|nr:hypothetical protein [Alphaproteobacteria bacterium]MBU0859618.1 hypothetical protein [Alphaproteobacteria bacterium]